MIKFGRVTLNQRKINLEGKEIGISMNYIKILQNLIYLIQLKKKKIKNKKYVKFVYCDDKEVNSPLLNPCKCSGGLKYIHFSCL